ncbi:MAG: cytochrome c oxidase assembly protein [Microcella sp.]|nr:MAG: cytochrome c oxidase assembly protein [Microcella sp.]
MTLVTTPLAPPGLDEFLGLSATTSFALPIAAMTIAVLYLIGAIGMWATGRRWSVARTISFVIGCGVIAATTGSALEDYSQVMLSVFMFEQLTLMMLVPPLLVLGSPGRLLLRSVPHRGLGRVVLAVSLSSLRSRSTRWLLHPVFSVSIFLLLFYGLYLGDLLDPILGLPIGHASLELVFLIAGIVFTIPILSDGPLPIRMSYPARALDLAAEVALHAFFGVFLMMSPTLFTDYFANPPASLGIDPLVDQGVAGGLAWSYGEAPTVLVLMYILHRWFRDDTDKATAADARADQHGNADLDAYNEYLARLRSRGGSDSSPAGEPG